MDGPTDLLIENHRRAVRERMWRRQDYMEAEAAYQAASKELRIARDEEEQAEEALRLHLRALAEGS